MWSDLRHTPFRPRAFTIVLAISKVLFANPHSDNGVVVGVSDLGVPGAFPCEVGCRLGSDFLNAKPT